MEVQCKCCFTFHITPDNSDTTQQSKAKEVQAKTN